MRVDLAFKYSTSWEMYEVSPLLHKPRSHINEGKHSLMWYIVVDSDDYKVASNSLLIPFRDGVFFPPAQPCCSFASDSFIHFISHETHTHTHTHTHTQNPL